MTNLTTRRLEAINEALGTRLAGEIETNCEYRDYVSAQAWAQEQLAKRKIAAPRKAP